MLRPFPTDVQEVVAAISPAQSPVQRNRRLRAALEDARERVRRAVVGGVHGRQLSPRGAP
jgi:hypothetical protein